MSEHQCGAISEAELELITELACRMWDFLKAERQEVVNEAIAGRIRKKLIETRNA